MGHTRETNARCHRRNAVVHHGNISSFNRAVGPANTHGNADVGLCERRSVVDAVADHRRKTLSLKLTNACKFGFRKQVSIHVLKSELAGKRMCGAFIVAREQPGRNAFGFELSKTASRISLDFVSHDKDCQYAEGIALRSTCRFRWLD